MSKIFSYFKESYVAIFCYLEKNFLKKNLKLSIRLKF